MFSAIWIHNKFENIKDSLTLSSSFFPFSVSVLAPVPLELDVAISVCIGYFQLLKLL